MHSGIRRFYYLISAAWIAGVSWIFFAMYSDGAPAGCSEVCFVKNIFGLPCPSCGTTRSVLLLLRGDFPDALMSNPLGLILAPLMCFIPFGIAFDLVTRRHIVWQTYHAIEQLFARKIIAIPAGILMALNWIWNINKGL